VAKAKKKAPEEDLGSILDRFKDPADPSGGRRASVDDDIEARITKAIDSALATRLPRQSLPMVDTAGSMTMPEQPKYVEMNLDGMPDPFADPEKYSQEFNKRQATVVQKNHAAWMDFEKRSRDAQATLSRRQEQAYEGLWDDFRDTYKEFADADETVEKRLAFVATDLVGKARARGVDTEAYMLKHRDQFFTDVVKGYKELFSESGESEAETEEKPSEQGQYDQQ